MDENDMERVRNILRVGTVMVVDLEKKRARVKYLETGEISDWLQVLGNVPVTEYEPEYAARTEYAAGGSGEATYASHRHDIKFLQWMPKVNDMVLCAFMPVFNGHGFVLGGIQVT